MKKEDKAVIIESIGKVLSEYSCFYLTQTSGLDAEKTSALRRECFKADVKMLCVKNTLLKQAFEASDVTRILSDLHLPDTSFPSKRNRQTGFPICPFFYTQYPHAKLLYFTGSSATIDSFESVDCAGNST